MQKKVTPATKVVKKEKEVIITPEVKVEIDESTPEVKVELNEIIIQPEETVIQPEIKDEIVEIIPEPKQETIHDKYRLYINQANSGFLRGCEYPKLMDMLRYVEKKIGHNLALNMQCPACLIDLVKMFARLEDKN